MANGGDVPFDWSRELKVETASEQTSGGDGRCAVTKICIGDGAWITATASAKATGFRRRLEVAKRRRRGTRHPRPHCRKAPRYDGGVEAVWLDDVMHYLRHQDRTAVI